MPAISPHSEAEWQRARDLVASGLEMPDVAERTGIPYEGLRKRAQREEWLIPSSAISLAKTGLSPVKQDDCPKIVPAEVILAESVAEMGTKGQISVLKGLLPKLMETFSPESALLAKEIESWKDAGTMANLFAKFSGLDKPQTQVSIGLFHDDVRPME